MSIGYVYVQAADGRWYREAKFKDNKDWFVCFDEDEPPEVVIRCNGKGANRDPVRTPSELLTELGIPFRKLQKREPCGMRVFDSNGKWQFAEAMSWFFQLDGLIPVPTAPYGFYEAVVDRVEDCRSGTCISGVRP